MPLDEERLFVSLEARITDFEKKFAQAERRGTKTYGQLRKDSASATRAMEADMNRATGRINQALAQGGAKMGALGKAWAAGLVGGIAGGLAAAGISGILTSVGQIANGVAAVGDEARRAGLSAKAFQEWKFVAEQNRIGIDAMVDGLKELSLRADEFAITGKGSAAEAFQRLGYSAEEVKKKLEDPSALLLEIIGRLELMDKAAQIRISDELFGGTAGERFVEGLAQGEEGIRRTITQANELGVIMDDQMIAKAAEVDRQFNIVASTVGTALKGAIVTAAAALADFISQFRSFQQQSAGVLRGNLATVQADLDGKNAALAQLEADAADLRNAAGSDPMAAAMLGPREGVLAEAKAARDATLAQRDAMQSRLDQIDPPIQFGPPAPGAPRPTTADGWTPSAYTPPPASSGGGGGSKARGKGSSTVDDLTREMEAIQKRTEALKAGTLAQSEINPLIQDFGRAAEFAQARTQLLLTAQQEGVPITDALRAKIDTLAASYADAAAASDQLDASQAEAVQSAERAASLRRETIGGFVNDLRNGVDASEALSNALGRLADRMADMALDALFAPQAGGGAAPLAGLLGAGAGGGTGLLGTLLGGVGAFFGFASGTGNTGGRRGEPRGIVHGQEAVVPLPSGGKIPVQLQGGGKTEETRQHTHVTVGVEVDGEGSIRAFVKDQVTKSEKRAVRTSVGAVQKGNRKSSRFLG